MDGILIPLYLSFKVAFFATLINAVIAVVSAYFLSKKKSFVNDIIESIIYLPMVLPPTVLGYYLLVILGSTTPLGHWLETYLGIKLIFTLQGAIIAAVIVTFPLVYKPAKTAFEQISPDYIYSARVLGIAEIAIFFRVMIPLALPGIFAGLILGYIRAMGEFGATLMIAGNIPGKTQTLSLAIYDAVQAGNDSMANTLVMVTVVICISALLIVSFFLKQKL